MTMNPTVLFLTTLGQSLATHSLYGAEHPMRATARDRTYAALQRVLGDRGALRLSFLDGAVIVGTRVMGELRGWEWGPRLATAGVQRLEIDALPEPTPHDVDLLLSELHERLGPSGNHSATVALRGFRFGPLSVATGRDEHDAVAGQLLRGFADLPLTEEVAAMRWIHDELTSGGALPMAEVEALVHSLAMAVHREQELVLPLLDSAQLDGFTTTHLCNVAMLAIGLAEQLGLSGADARAIGTAALLHDIGKVKIPPELLTSSVPLSPADSLRVQSHTVEGARLLSGRGRGHALAATVAYEHHQWHEGNGGYPALHWPRRAHFASRLVQVCDVYDSLSTPRPYREALAAADVLARLEQQAGQELDPAMVRAFLDLLARADLTRSADVNAVTVAV